MDDPLDALVSIVAAHNVVDEESGLRERLIYLTGYGAGFRGHLTVNSDDLPHVDTSTLEDMSAAGWIDIEYGNSSFKIAPTPYGRQLVASKERIDAYDVSETDGIVAAVATQSADVNPLSWNSVRPVLEAMRKQWAQDNFPSMGLPTARVFEQLPAENRGLFAETLRSLESSRYIESANPELQTHDAPAEVKFTDRSLQALDGWPGATGNQIAENLLSVVAAAAMAESNPDDRSKLEHLGEAARDLGIDLLSEVISKAVWGR